MEYFKKLEELLLITARQNASDLHIAVGRKPSIRIDGSLVPLEKEPYTTPEVAEGLILGLLTDVQKERYEKNKEVDFSYAFQDKARFRVNAFMQRGFKAAALRLIPTDIKNIQELNLPPIVSDFAKLRQGFVLVVGPAGHGKSTTLAAILDEINHSRTSHIITIEDPIEYLFVQDRAIISQREVGGDTVNFHAALKSLLRQDPDVIMIGEMRDPESISTALTAAETGHLVFATLHTNSASQTIDRIIDSFPASQQGQITSQLSAALVGVVSERLVPRINGGRIPVCEVMLANPAIRNLVREKKAYQIDLVIETSLQEGMITMNRSLASLVKRREISLENAELYSLNPSELRILLERS
ncbi:MAG: type IV pili twitching motility protein PilT [Candidatus Harrisonbacteria bacterium CG10_big_fil_rev_8_21_14_0_10_42_17]|uniref:Type IV pili twitching motility protein PilT n=1 Tax=Candidatus Harrisonbacteria bacterium CG10_big_fil_rev_8_21_14_0_10_42_17 TaxID=1974584 RepID=A0A2M6WHB5_9BACT|nr:MAG: type IV pili twitching motility protein PilT [Candidatus Harrisonbacteria bacterium CG10_big_fil_rev_8_21_14_0_10_42_17]